MSIAARRTAGKRVLFVAELGGGFGHVRRMLPLARAVARAGRRPVLLVPNPDEVAGLVDPEIEVARAPMAPRPPRAGESPGDLAHSFADILARAGFDDADFLDGAVHVWRRAIDDLRPEAAVCEFSPFFSLATAGGQLPVLVTGYGFVLPPPELRRFPTLIDGGQDDVEDRIRAEANRARERHHLSLLDVLPGLMRGTMHAVTGLRSLDPYAGVRGTPAVGPPGLDLRRLADVPFDSAPDDMFGYLLGDAPRTLDLLRALATSGLSGQVFVRRATDRHRDAVSGSRVVLRDRPVPVAEALRRARAVVHHASMLSSEEAVIVGRPQLVLPLYFEHLLTARALARQGVARVIRPGTNAEEMASLARSVCTGTDGIHAARQFALETGRTLPPPELAATLVEALL